MLKCKVTRFNFGDPGASHHDSQVKTTPGFLRSFL